MTDPLPSSPPCPIVAWERAVHSLEETGRLVNDLAARIDRLGELGVEGLADLSALLDFLVRGNRNWQSGLLPKIAGNLPGSLFHVASSDQIGAQSLPDLLALHQELASRRACALEAEQELSEISRRLRRGRKELDAECRRLKLVQRNEAAQIDVLADQANDVLRQARQHVQRIKDDQDRWYSPLVSYWKVLLNLGGAITSARIVDSVFDLRDSIQELLGAVGITDGIPDSLKERIEAIEGEWRNLFARRERLDWIDNELCAIAALDGRLAQNLSDLSKITSFWCALEGKIQAAIASIQRATEASTAEVRKLHISAARHSVGQLADYARSMDLRPQFQL